MGGAHQLKAALLKPVGGAGGEEHHPPKARQPCFLLCTSPQPASLKSPGLAPTDNRMLVPDIGVKPTEFMFDKTAASWGLRMRVG